MASTIIIITVALALVVGGVGFLLFGVLKLPFSLIGNAVAWLVKPVAKLFRRKGGGDTVASTPGVEEVPSTMPMAPAAAAA